MTSLTLIHIFYRQKICLLLKTLLGTLIVLAIIGCTSQSVILTTPKSLQDVMNNATHLRSQAEQRVLLVKHANQQTTINGEEYQSAQGLYEVSKDSFDLWIDQVQDNLRSGKRIDNPDVYNMLVRNANKQSEAFIDYVDELLQMVSRGVSKKEIESFIKTGIDLVQTVQKIDREKRQALISELDEIRWQAFDAI